MAEVRFRLEKERDFRASMYKKYRRGANVVDGIDTALSVTSVGLNRPKAGPPPPFFQKKNRSALNELVQADISTLKRPKASRLYTAYLEY